MSDYLALITTSLGGGSWARDADKEKAVKRAASIFKQDWKHLFKVGKKGSTVIVNVLDVEGYDKVTWNDHGNFKGDGQAIDRPLEQVTHVY